ncbi:MAG TPA: isoprenylcysteine carboxylmethyltransferase family protein [Stellaceae bacterium]|nr:isoprenylcysteine carboxylmethyltransferase family protein [Stellaceae bacterium]
MSAAALLLGFVALQRLGELGWATRNTRALRRCGAEEHGRAHYPAIIALHVGWLAALFLGAAPETAIRWPPLAAFLALQGLRLWAIAALGPYWTTRVITLPQAPLVRRGPYRYLRHPNYLVVALEVPLLSLALGAWRTALLFTPLNLLALAWRIRVEERALAGRRTIPFAADPLMQQHGASFATPPAAAPQDEEHGAWQPR